MTGRPPSHTFEVKFLQWIIAEVVIKILHANTYLEWRAEGKSFCRHLPQKTDDLDSIYYLDPGPQRIDEDCLYLNVWTPPPDRMSFPKTPFSTTTTKDLAWTRQLAQPVESGK
jgi:hypothetical protein